MEEADKKVNIPKEAPGEIGKEQVKVEGGGSIGLFRNLTIAKKLMIIIFSMLVLSIISFGTIRYFHEIQYEDGAIIDASGRDRMLSQRIGFYSEQVLNGDESAGAVLKEIIDLHDVSFYALKDGGVAPGIANDRVLPPTNEEIMPLVEITEELWIRYKANGYVIVNEPTFIDGEVNPEVQKAMEFIEDNGPDMLNRNNDMVAAYVLMNDSKRARLNFALIIILILSLLLTIFGYFIAKSVTIPIREFEMFTGPIKELGVFTKDVGSGKLDIKVSDELLNRKDEIGDLARSFDEMLTSLKNSKLQLIEKAEGLKEMKDATINTLKDVEQSRKKLILSEKEVRAKNKELENFAKIAGGREKRIIELKKKLAESGAGSPVEPVSSVAPVVSKKIVKKVVKPVAKPVTEAEKKV